MIANRIRSKNFLSQDVTPIFTPGWLDFYTNGTTLPTTENQTISDIKVPIEIYFEYDNSFVPEMTLEYSTDDGSNWFSWNTNVNITVTNGSSIKLRASGSPGTYLAIFIKNASDNDTIIANMVFESVPPP
jgi:hypothetical protein